MVVHNSSMLLKAISDAIVNRLAKCNVADLTQFLAEVTMVSNVLGVCSALFLIIYIKIAYPCLACDTAPRTFHSNRYQIIAYTGNKAIKESMHSDLKVVEKMFSMDKPIYWPRAPFFKN